MDAPAADVKRAPVLRVISGIALTDVKLLIIFNPIATGAFAFRFQGINFRLQRLVLFHLALEEAPRHGHLLGNASRGQNVHVLELVLAVLKVLQLDQALVHQRIQAVVQPAQAHAKPLGQVALANVGALLQDAHDPEGGVFLNLGLTAAHVVGLGTLPPCRVAIGMRGGVKLAVVPSNVRT